MGYNVSPEVMAAFREKNAAENAWNRKRMFKKIIKWFIIIALILAVAIFGMRTVRIKAQRKMVAGKWNECSRLGIEVIEIEDDSRFKFTMYNEQILKGTYKIGSQCSGAVQKREWSSEADILEERYVYIDFTNNNKEVVLTGMYDTENDIIKLYSMGSWSSVERID